MSRCCAAILNIQRCTRTVSKHAVTTRGTTWLKRSEFATNSPHPQRLSTIAQPTLDKEGLHITDACVSQIKKVASPEEFLRVLVEGGGCSGFTYKFELDTEIQEDDRTFEKDEIKVVCDEDSLALIKGSLIDYEEELIKCAFRIKNNPQSSNSCSCGVSFSVDL